MADDVVSVQPATQVPSAAPILIRFFNAQLPDGRTVEIQGVALLDPNNRPISVMTEETGQRLLDVMTKLHDLLASANGSPPYSP